jgi:prepilin-type N-terminal cleavage/methylation domain-containing protein
MQVFERLKEARRNGENGFTLIELLIVIVILGILAAIVVFSVQGITDRGDKSACKADVATVQAAEEANYAQTGSYTDVAGLKTANLIHSTPTDVSVNTTTGLVTGQAPCAGYTAGS